MVLVSSTVTQLVFVVSSFHHASVAYRFADHVLPSEDYDYSLIQHSPPPAASNNDHRRQQQQKQQWQSVTHLADIPPPTANNQSYRDDWRRSDWILSQYWDENAGFSKTDDNIHHSLTYGEVTSLGVRQLAYEMGIAMNTIINNNNDHHDAVDHKDNEKCSGSTKDVIFYDLGSGVGRLVTQLYFDQPHRICKAVGVELALDRHEIAQRALADIQSTTSSTSTSMEHLLVAFIGEESSVELEDPKPVPIVLLQVDVMQTNWTDATHVFMSSLCFPEEVLDSLHVQIIEQKLPNLQVVAALNRLQVLRHRPDIWEEREVHIQMSWGPGVAKIYRKI